MSFSDIVGHEKQLASLQGALEKERLHHAYLFLGPEGVGKRTIAVSLAMAIQCLGNNYDFCGRCANCVRIQNRNHPDVRMVEPLAGKKEISIQQVRELERELSFRPFSGQKKIVILDPAPLMNASAQNALLKTLEEPPRDSLLILISTSTGGLLATLLSRCLRLSFAAPPLELVADFLVSQKGRQREEAKLLAAMTMGSLGKALSPEMEELARRRKVWAEGLASVTPRDYRGCAALAEGLAGDREESLKFLEWVESWYRDLLIYSVTQQSQSLINIDMAENLAQQENSHSLGQTLFLLSQTSVAAARIRRNVNRRMALEDFLMKVSRSEFRG